MNSKYKNLINIALMVILLVITISVIFKDNEVEDIIAVLKEGNPVYVFAGLLTILVSWACESLIIYITFRSLEEKIRFIRCLKYTFIGFYYSAITPSSSGGQPMQIVYMSRDGYKFTSSSITILLVVIVYKVVLLGLIGFTMITNGSFAFEYIGMVKWLFIFGVAVNVICISLYVMIFISSDLLKKIIVKGIGFLHRIKLIRHKQRKIDKITELIDDYEKGTKFIIKNPKLLIVTLIITVVQRVLLFSIPFIIYKYFGLNDLSYLEIITLQIILNTAVDNLPIPGGIGVTELAFKVLYSAVFSAAVFVPSMLMSRFIVFYFMLIISAVVTFIAHISSFRKRVVIK